MSVAIEELGAFGLSIGLMAGMLVSWSIAWWLGSRSDPNQSLQSASKFNDAVLAMLGLLLAFTFSMSLARHEMRRQMAVQDSNAIGDFYTASSLVSEPQRGQLQAVIREYVEHRLKLATKQLSETALQESMDEVRSFHAKMQELVEQSVIGGTSVVVPLVNTLNDVTSGHASRLAAINDRLPASIILLLSVASIVSMILIGRQQGSAREFHPAGMFGFTLLVCMVVWVTFDLNQPQLGWIVVSQEPMEQLLKGIGP